MEKLFKLKNWLTIADAAKHLSGVFEEEVSEADVLRLGLDGHLQLSADFVNHARAIHGKVVPLSKAEFYELKNPVTGVPEMIDGKPVMTLSGLRINETDVLELDGDVVSIKGVWDLAMIGSEMLDLEHWYQQLTGGPEVTLQFLEGPFVSQEQGHVWQLQDSIKEREIDTPQGKRKFPQSYYPAAALPGDSVLVVRVGALRDLQEKISGNTVKSLATRAESSYQNIIAALLEVISHGIPSPDTPHLSIGPAENFQTEAKLISAIAAHFEGFDGLSRSNLQRKFPAAKRNITS